MKAIFSLTILTLFISSLAFGQTDWEIKNEQNGIKVWTKDYPDSKFKQFKAKARIKANLENVVAVFLTIEDMGKWYDRVKSVEVVKKISHMEGIYQINFVLPWPVSDRISAVRAILSYDKETKVVKVSTVYEPGIITESDKWIVTDIHSTWVLSPVDGGYVDIIHKGYMHPGGNLPAWVANSGLIQGPIKTITKLQKILPAYNHIKVDFMN